MVGHMPCQGKLGQVGLIGMLDQQLYLDDQQTDNTFPALKEEVIFEAGDKNIQAFIMTPCGNTFACGNHSQPQARC